MEESLFRRAKVEAARQGRPMSALLEEALERYFSDPSVGPVSQYRSVAETWGAMQAPAGIIREIMEDDDEYFES